MYSKRSGLIFGFHGCDESVALDVVNRKTILRESQNSYDWLGHGIYFWENSPERALEYASFLKEMQDSEKKTTSKYVSLIQIALKDSSYLVN